MLIKRPECELMVSDKAAACPHDGRVTFVTFAKKYNVDEYAIKYIVGHKIKDLTERVYTKREIEWLQKELAKIPSGEIFGFEK